MYGLYVYFICMVYMYTLYVWFICILYMYDVHLLILTLAWPTEHTTCLARRYFTSARKMVRSCGLHTFNAHLDF